MILDYPRSTTTYKITGSKTFRQGSAMVIGIYGENLQNKDKDVRKLYLSDGWNVNDYHNLLDYLISGDIDSFNTEQINRIKLLLQVDQSGAEALIVSYLCRAGKFRDLFIYGVKPHVFVALHVFHNEWRKRCNDLDIDKFLHAKPAELTSIQGWKELDKLIKSSDDWAAHERYYYIAKMICHACVTGDHEVLTPEGWIPIDQLTKEHKLAIWDKDDSIKFEHPFETFKYEYKGELIQFNEPQLDQLVTPNHRIVYAANKKYHTKCADDIIEYKGAKIPTAGLYSQGNINLSSDAVKFITAIQADGYIINESTVRFRFQKTKKVDRLREILKNLNLSYDFKFGNDLAYEFYIRECNGYLKWFKIKKEWGPFLLTWSAINLDTLIDELKYWDGTYEVDYLHKREAYFSNNINNINWIKTILHLRNKQGTFSTGNRTYILGINRRTKSRLHGGRKLNFAGMVYCPKVSTGYFLIRRNGKISVTGNSNYGMRGPTFAINTLQKSEGSIRLSEKQATEYLEAYHKIFPEIRIWHLDIQDQLSKQKSVLYNLFGEPREFNSPWGDMLFRDAYSFIPQSTVGQITNRAKSRVQMHINNGDIIDTDQLQNGHDSILAQTLVGQEAFIAKFLQHYIEIDMVSPRGEPFKMKSECGIGFNWGPMKVRKDGSIYNPLGMREVRFA